ncbi:unnamed protein product [Cuscuta epithymum]|uniref:Uncharacterized protein n=1 Tax=Cuscuta epithymum TaxID=186058 RepID=A0AAV0CKJ1_9ASTE|nr:unnamed protein product [Cuscuta epithymum]
MEDMEAQSLTGSIESQNCARPEIHDCVIKLRENPQRRKNEVFIGCGAGFGGDRPLAALKLLQRVKELDYLVLECLAERTLADHHRSMKSGGKGYDPRISEWMQLLLPLAVERGVCIITNMGAKNPSCARDEVLRVASRLGINITIGLAYQHRVLRSGLKDVLRDDDADVSTYLGAAPIVECLERYGPNVVITSRVADASLFLGPMVYELGWNWDEVNLLAQGSLAGHLLECGCQLTGGYYMHPGDKYRDISFQDLLNLSLPFVRVKYDGSVCVAKAENSGGLLNSSTCAEQLLYEVGDPGKYITPDVIVDFQDVIFQPLSKNKVLCIGAKPYIQAIPDKLLLLASKDQGWKGWGEISYGGYECVKRAEAAEFLVKSWMEEIYPGVNKHIISYIIGFDSLKAMSMDNKAARHCEDIRLRMDGLFEEEEIAIQFTREFTALYTNGPAGGGGVSTGWKKELILEKELVSREDVQWGISAMDMCITTSNAQTDDLQKVVLASDKHCHETFSKEEGTISDFRDPQLNCCSPAPSGTMTPLYDIAHSRAGDKGNDLNFSLIPHFPADVERLKIVITPDWVKEAVSPLLNPTSFPTSDDIELRNQWVSENVKVEIYQVRGIHSLNVVVRDILDGGVNCSRRIDRHGKTVSDLILSQHIMLPP